MADEVLQHRGFEVQAHIQESIEVENKGEVVQVAEPKDISVEA